MEAVTSPGTLDDATACVQEGKFDEALSILRAKALRGEPDGHVHALMGICLAQQGNLDGAVKSLETAALLNPRDPAVEYNLANALFRIGRTDQARWRLTRILEDDPAHADARLLLTHIQRFNAAGTRQANPTTVPVQRGVAGPVGNGSARAALHGGFVQAPTTEVGDAPGTGVRLLRGLGWGLVYSLWWTAFSLFAALAMSLFATRVEHAIIAFLLLCLVSVVFHSAMGMLTGIVVALTNADEDSGGWVGMCVGFFILLIGVRFGFLAMWAVVFYLLVGRGIGKSVAFRVQKPVVAA